MPYLTPIPRRSTPTATPGPSRTERALVIPKVHDRTRAQVRRIVTDGDRLQAAMEIMQQGKFSNLTPILPLMLRLNGEPFTLKEHFCFEPFYETAISQKMVWKCARQTGKSTSLAGKGVLMAGTIPYFNMLYVTPLFETIRRFSSNYVQPFIDESPIKRLLVNSSCNNSVLQRTFINRSTMFFSFAFLDATRVRGIPASGCLYDEVQDLDSSFIPVIQEVTSGSKWALSWFAGTPKTLDGPLERQWQMSSQAEWHIECKACGHENIPALGHDLEDMIGPPVVLREVSENLPGCVCGKCQRPVYPRTGHWIHKYPERRLDYPGYHVPQIITPMHYADKVKWSTLLGKREGMAQNTFLNEVCAESFDIGARLITQTELQNACTKHPNTLEFAESMAKHYDFRVVSVDWGGGGENQQSFTVVTCMGITGSGRVDVLFGHKFRITHDYAQECLAILSVFKRFRAHRMVHDFGGAGAIREHLFVTAGLSNQSIIPVAYVRASTGASIMRYKAENTDTGQRSYHQVDKARSLVLICHLIRHGGLTFFEYDFKGADRPGLIHDFLSLTERRVISRFGMDVYTVVPADLTGVSDDFAQAVNIGACALFYMVNKWPDVAVLSKIRLNPEMLNDAEALGIDWARI